jgi:hypothetical protein
MLYRGNNRIHVCPTKNRPVFMVPAQVLASYSQESGAQPFFQVENRDSGRNVAGLDLKITRISALPPYLTIRHSRLRRITVLFRSIVSATPGL